MQKKTFAKKVQFSSASYIKLFDRFAQGFASLRKCYERVMSGLRALVFCVCVIFSHSALETCFFLLVKVLHSRCSHSLFSIAVAIFYVRFFRFDFFSFVHKKVTKNKLFHRDFLEIFVEKKLHDLSI